MDNKSIFRKSALERMQTPDELNDYIRVTTPSAWLLAAAVGVLLAGFVIWGIFGSVEIANANGVAELIRPIEFLIGG